MKLLEENAPWEEIMEMVELIGILEDPYGRKGFFDVRIGKWIKNNSCHVDFHCETSPTSWAVEKISNSFAELPLKKVMTNAINSFTRWYNETGRFLDTFENQKT